MKQNTARIKAGLFLIIIIGLTYVALERINKAFHSLNEFGAAVAYKSKIEDMSKEAGRTHPELGKALGDYKAAYVEINRLMYESMISMAGLAIVSVLLLIKFHKRSSS